MKQSDSFLRINSQVLGHIKRELDAIDETLTAMIAVAEPGYVDGIQEVARGIRAHVRDIKRLLPSEYEDVPF